MVKKSIAAALLMAMVAWAEMALAPMLAMQAHVHLASAIAEHAAHHHAMPAGHPCCPKIGGTSKPDDSALIEFASSSLPCQDEHRCCFRQGPQNVPAPVSAGNRLTWEIAPAQTAQLGPADGNEPQVFPPTTFMLGPPPSLLGMVLRV